jgi:hypothetical protein
MLRRLFLDHPRSVGESYGEHLRFAGGFGLTMIAGGVGAIAHALVPALFPRTGSAALARLNARLEESRRAAAERSVRDTSG